MILISTAIIIIIIHIIIIIIIIISHGAVLWTPQGDPAMWDKFFATDVVPATGTP